MKILLSGSSGLVGTELIKSLKDKGFNIVRLVRNKKDNDKDVIRWDPEKQVIDSGSLEGFDAVIHLAGENIAGGRWNAERKQKILNSRVKSTQFLSQTLSRLNRPPRVFISASAVGFYGDRNDTICNEESGNGKGFLVEVCKQWEEATQIASSAGIRTVNLRFGIILSPKGGALAKMLTPFKFGLGGVLGSGNQYMSWIAIDDVIGIILHVIYDLSLSGAINSVAPAPVTNREFTKILGEVLHRPTIIPVPVIALHFMLGQEMADELLLSSTRAVPSRLIKSGYSFIYPELKNALKELLQNRAMDH